MVYWIAQSGRKTKFAEECGRLAKQGDSVKRGLGTSSASGAGGVREHSPAGRRLPRSPFRILQHSSRYTSDEFVALISHLIANAVDGVSNLVRVVTGNVLRSAARNTSLRDLFSRRARRSTFSNNSPGIDTAVPMPLVSPLWQEADP
jgi:hypothetical protein